MVKDYRRDIYQINKTDVNPAYFWQETADEINGVFTRSRSDSHIEGLNDSFNLKILKKYQGIEIELNSIFKTHFFDKDKFLVSDLKIQTTLSNQLDFHLFIWKKRQLKKLFSWNKQISGFEDFDRIVEFRTNREQEVQNFLSTKEIRGLFVQQDEILFKVQFEDGVLKISYQANEIVCNAEALLYEYFNYEYIIDGLINAGLINHNNLQLVNSW